MIQESLRQALAELDAQGLKRRRRTLESGQGARVRVDGRELLSFASNDYLGLAHHPDIAAAARSAVNDYGVGAGASHLLTGHHILHHQAEVALAALVGMPQALLFSTGYMANLAVVTALLGREGAVFADKLNHASLVDAALLSRAEHVRYPHLDLDALERKLRASQAMTKLIASDAVFSMDGDIAPVPELLRLAEQYDAWLFLDDAHGFGVLGQEGRGALEHSGLAASIIATHPSLIYLATLGKAAGVAGAFVAAGDDVIDWLVNRARTYIYTTAQPPLLAAAALASLQLIRGETWRRQHLARLIAYLKQGVAGLPWALMRSDTPIQPLLVGENAAALRLSEGLLDRGILVPAIRPPTVPPGKARLRISLSADHTEADLDVLLTALKALAHG
jgi:8-amino-7-oxononanoate synthase